MPQAPATEGAPRRVLIVDDERAVRELVAAVLGDACEASFAADGAAGIEVASASLPDLVISDVVMPGKTGFELVDALKADPATRHIPVLLLTGEGEVRRVVEGLERGADDYVVKPFHPLELRARVRALLRLTALERELARSNRRLELRVEKLVAELILTGELERFVPRAVAERVVRGELRGDRRLERLLVTILFVDIVRFTEMIGSLEPEEVAALLNDYLREMCAVAVRQGGLLDKFIGDAVMVLFGAPGPSDPGEQAWRAVDCALEMTSRVRELSAGWRRRGLPFDLHVRVGLNTGFCTVGLFGGDFLESYTAIGSPVNVAARLQALAPEDGVLCAAATYGLVSERVAAQARGLLTLRGVAHPVEAYEVRGRR